jgi:hypothetical protein
MRHHGAVNRRHLALIAVISVLCLVIAALILTRIRGQEWEHGGDALSASAEVRLAGQADVGTASAAFGLKDVTMAAGIAKQAAIVRVRWTGPDDGGSYAFMALDRRVNRPLPLRVFAGWDAASGGTGSHWDGRYEVLSQHYPWLAGTASVQTGSGWTDTSQAVGTPAAATGSLTAIFLVDDGQLPITAPRDVLVTVIHTDEDNEVRWAKQIPHSA